MCDSSSYSLYGISFLNRAMDWVLCESKWVQETIHRFLCGKCQHVGITDLNHTIKYNQYQNLVGSCPVFVGGYLFDTEILHLAGVSHKL